MTLVSIGFSKFVGLMFKNKKSSILILSGTKDRRVNPKQADRIAEKLAELNHDFELKKLDTDHSFLSKQNELQALVKKWFDERL